MKIFAIFVLGFILGAPSIVLGQSSKAERLDGTVYDARGIAIETATVTAVDAKGKKFETKTNTEGEYSLNLPYKNTYPSVVYTISVVCLGFQKTEIENFKFVPAKRGFMRLDIALDVGKIWTP